MIPQVYSLAAISEEMGEFVSSAVRAFADSRKLHYDLWHKGAPTWVITDLDWFQSNIGPRVNKLEVAVFHTDNSLEIIIFPDAYRIENGQRRSISPGLRQDLSQRLLFNEFHTAITQKGDVGAREILEPVLRRAWNSLIETPNEKLTWPSQGRQST